MELVVEDEDDGANELEMGATYGKTGSAGTGGIPAAAREALLLLRLLTYLGDGAELLPWFESEIRRLWLG